MTVKFKVGNRITTNSLFNEKRIHDIWWNKHKGNIMTIKDFRESGKWCTVHENMYYWKLEEMIKEKDFITREEFEV